VRRAPDEGPVHSQRYKPPECRSINLDCKEQLLRAVQRPLHLRGMQRSFACFRPASRDERLCSG